MENFVFTSPTLPIRKAKQLQSTFPFLKLSVAQEATARAMGYTSWFECLGRGTTGSPSALDQVAGIPTRVARLYHQASVLSSIGISPSQADLWIRAWGLTGSPTLAPSSARPVYYSWLDAAKRIQRGELTEKQIAIEWEEADWSKYPNVDRPIEVCPGVVLSPCGKYPHYAVDPAILARTPAYLRGVRSLYHYEDDGCFLSAIVPSFQDDLGESLVSRFNHLQYEWHFGTKHPEALRLLAPELQAASLATPNAMVVLSIRAMPLATGDHSFDRYAVACLRGVDFAEFIAAKGHVNPSKVVWFSQVDPQQLPIDPDWLSKPNFAAALPIFESDQTLRPCLPIYSYPFKNAPMATDEYNTSYEACSMIALHLDYDGDGGGNDDEVHHPQDPTSPSILEAELT